MVYSLIEWWVRQMWKWYIREPLWVLLRWDILDTLVAIRTGYRGPFELVDESRRCAAFEHYRKMQIEGQKKVREAMGAYREAQQAARPRGGSGVKEPQRYYIARNVPEYLPMEEAVVEVSKEIFHEWEKRDAYLRETGWDDFNALRELDDWLVENGRLRF